MSFTAPPTECKAEITARRFMHTNEAILGLGALTLSHRPGRACNAHKAHTTRRTGAELLVPVLTLAYSWAERKELGTEMLGSPHASSQAALKTKNIRVVAAV